MEMVLCLTLRVTSQMLVVADSPQCVSLLATHSLPLPSQIPPQLRHDGPRSTPRTQHTTAHPHTRLVLPCTPSSPAARNPAGFCTLRMYDIVSAKGKEYFTSWFASLFQENEEGKVFDEYPGVTFVSRDSAHLIHEV